MSWRLLCLSCGSHSLGSEETVYIVDNGVKEV